MLGRRLFAIIIAGVLVLSSFNANVFTVRAAEDEDILILEDTDEFEEDFFETEESDQPIGAFLKDDDEVERDTFEEDMDSADEFLDTQSIREATDGEDTATYSIKFYPGEGKLIERFGLSEDISSWDYDKESGVLTLYAPGSDSALRSFDYVLAASDGSRVVEGWYFDEALTEPADFGEGISLKSDIILYAKYVDAEMPNSEEDNTSGTSISSIPFDVKKVLTAFGKKLLGISEPEAEEIVNAAPSENGAAVEEPSDEDILTFEDGEPEEETYDEEPKEPEEDEYFYDTLPDSASYFEDYDQEFDIDERDAELFENIDIANSKFIVGGTYAMDYTGEAVTYDEDDLRVYYNGVMLTEGIDYKLSYSNNTNAFIAPDDFEDLSESEKAALNPPTVKITFKGNYSGSVQAYFDINPIDISEAHLTSSGALTARYYDKSFAQNPVIKADLYNGKTITLSSKTDYEIFYNKIDYSYGEEIVDYDNPLTAEELAADIKECMEEDPEEDVYYLVNIRGKKNFSGILASDEDGTNWAPTLQVLCKASVEENYLQLDDAKLSKKVATQNYREDAKGTPLSVSEDVIKLFEDGTITVKVGKQKLKYIGDDKAQSAINSEGYYYRIVDPAKDDPDLNRYVGSDNYVTLVPADKPEFNRLAGEYNVFFDIKGTKISVKSIQTKLNYDGNYVLVYSDKDLDGDGYLDVDTQATLSRLNAVVIDSNKQALSNDRFTVSTSYDRSDVGTVTVYFEGNPDRGITGIVSKKIKIVKARLTANDVKVNFSNPNLDPNAVPMVGGIASPEITVTLNNGKKLTKDEDYTVKYAKNDAAGKTATVTVKFDGNYSGKISNALTFTVAQQKLDKNAIDVEALDKVYKEKAGKNYFKSTPKLYVDGVQLKQKTDYIYVDDPKYYYAENIVEKNKEGKIVYSRDEGTPIPDTEVVHAGALINMKFSVVPSAKNKKYITDKDAKGNYIPIQLSVNYRMGQMSIASAKGTIADQEYDNGKHVIPRKEDITITIGSGSKAVVLEDSDYTIVDSINSEKVGRATLVIEGKGRYVGTKKIKYSIVKSKAIIN